MVPGDRAKFGPKPLEDWLGGAASLGAGGESSRLTLPSPEEEAILRRCSCSEGSEAYWASS